MQASAPEAVDLSGESAHTRRLYGLDNPVTEGFGRQCLLARRMVERGVRYSLLVHGVEINKHSWDDHSNVEGRMRNHAAEVDLPVAGLLQDLKQRGLLEETLVVWASEMGRTPFVNDLKSKTPGRDHNQFALVMWLAGGDVKGGATAGATDEFGLKALEEQIPLRDVHATILNLLGLDDRRPHLPPWRALPPLDRHRRPRAPRDHRLTHRSPTLSGSDRVSGAPVPGRHGVQWAATRNDKGMNGMTTAVFDTLKAARHLEDAGIETKQAEAIVTTMAKAFDDSVATKADLAVKADLGAVKAELKQGQRGPQGRTCHRSQPDAASTTRHCRIALCRSQAVLAKPSNLS